VGPAELLEHAGKDEPQSALAVRHPRQSRVLAFVFENSLQEEGKK